MDQPERQRARRWYEQNEEHRYANTIIMTIPVPTSPSPARRAHARARGDARSRRRCGAGACASGGRRARDQDPTSTPSRLVLQPRAPSRRSCARAPSRHALVRTAMSWSCAIFTSRGPPCQRGSHAADAPEAAAAVLRRRAMNGQLALRAASYTRSSVGASSAQVSLQGFTIGPSAIRDSGRRRPALTRHRRACDRAANELVVMGEREQAPERAGSVGRAAFARGRGAEDVVGAAVRRT